MGIVDQVALSASRRSFLGTASRGLGAAALASLLNPARGKEIHSGYRGVIDPLHFAPKAKRVIWLYMSGGPSHIETFDNKPALVGLDGQPMPESFTAGQPIAQLQGQALKCLAPQFKFQRCGKSGQQISELFPHL